MNDKWMRVVGIPLVALLMQVVPRGVPARLDEGWLVDYLVSLSITATAWETNRLLSWFLRRRFPNYAHTGRRLAVQTVVSVALTFGATVALDAGWQVFFGKEVYAEDELLRNCFINLLPLLFVTLFYESVYFFGEWKNNLRRSEALARAGIQTELEMLRSQLDPHFMFNSLNTLAALIEDDNEPAHTYLEQLADVYRYVLLSRDKTTVPLHEEMTFVQAYLYLNKTRFRDDLQVEQRIAPAAYATRVAPLSLQLLVENAIKHNVISPEHPLCVTLATEPGAQYVRVQNNVQPKTGLQSSTKVGLRNLITQYQLLSAQPVEVQREEGLFTVRVPLLT